MELTPLRYFLAVADAQSVTRAAEAIPISAGSLTKAIQKLEAELGVKLFERRGRRIQLTERGRALQLHARALLQQEEEIRLEVAGPDQPTRVVLAGEEALLGSFATRWMRDLARDRPGATFEVRSAEPDQLVPRLRRGEIQVAFTTQPGPGDCKTRRLGEVEFVTCAATSHPLGRSRRRGPLPVQALLEFGFVVPTSRLLGAVGALQSNDGWRDDEFPRRISATADSLHQLLSLAQAGLALAYLPDHLAESLGLKVLAISGCDYQCRQPVNLLVHLTRAPRWLRARG